jgi:hypothetical protein
MKCAEIAGEIAYTKRQLVSIGVPTSHLITPDCVEAVRHD